MKYIPCTVSNPARRQFPARQQGDYHRHVTIEESVAIFLSIVSQGSRHRKATADFHHSTETINQQFKRVMRALASLGVSIIRPRLPYQMPPETLNNEEYYPWFKDAIGVIDGTHVGAAKRNGYCGRKTTITKNVMAACSFDMRFVFVMSGLEGSANDSRVFMDIITNEELKFPMPPGGMYYVVDSGYTNMPGFLSPYQGERYHLPEFDGGRLAPHGPKELFNYQHSSLRNVIERCFGVLKARFPILKTMPSYVPACQPLIVIACCAVDNFFRMHSTGDTLFEQCECDNAPVDNLGQSSTNQWPTRVDTSTAQLNAMSQLRDMIAAIMWQEHRCRG